MKPASLSSCTFAAAMLFAAQATAADAPVSRSVYKCKGTDGAAVYQDVPCPPERTLRDFAADPSTVSVIPFAGSARSPASGPSPKPQVKAAARGQQAGAARGDPAERKHLREGMSEGEVLARLGPPDMTSGKSGKVRWTYMPVPGDPGTITTLRLDGGKVVAVERSVVR